MKMNGGVGDRGSGDYDSDDDKDFEGDDDCDGGGDVYDNDDDAE